MTAMPMTLGDLCELKYGKSLPATQRQHGPATVYGSNGPVGTHSEALLSGPAIVVGRKGSYGEVHYSDGDLWPIDTTYFVDRSATKCDLRWLYHLLKYLPLTTLNKAAAIPGLSREDAYRLPVTKPPLDEQRRIAAILDKADALRRKRKHAVELLDGLAQSIFLEMFGEHIFGASEAHLREIGEIADLQNGAYYPAEQYTGSQDGIEMVHMSDAFYGSVRRGNLKRVNCVASDIRKYRLLPSDVIIARRSLNLEGAAKPCLIPNSPEPLIYESSFIRARCNQDTITAIYLYHYLSHPFVRKKYLNPYITQSTISGINQSNLSRVKIFVPHISKQNLFLSYVASVENENNKMTDQLDLKESLFSSLQHRAFTGQL